SSVVAAISSLLASAESSSVSFVMNVLLTQSAREYLRFRSSRRFSASEMNFAASAALELALADGWLLLTHELIRHKTRTRQKTAASQTWRAETLGFTFDLQRNHVDGDCWGTPNIAMIAAIIKERDHAVTHGCWREGPFSLNLWARLSIFQRGGDRNEIKSSRG